MTMRGLGPVMAAMAGLVLAGCGVSGHVAVQPGKTDTSGSTTPSAAPTPSSRSAAVPSTPSSVATASPSSPSAAAATSEVGLSQEIGRYVAEARVGLSFVAPSYWPRGNPKQFLAADVETGPGLYTVHLRDTTTPLPLNSPQINNAPNGGLAQALGGFGAEQYENPAQARSDFADVNGYYVTPQGTVEDVGLGHGITGTVQGDAVMWHEGDWTFEVSGSPSVYNEAVAKGMVVYLSGHLLPETYGLAAVDNAGDGEHTDLTWAEGSVLYHASDYHHALGALKMAVSMRQNP